MSAPESQRVAVNQQGHYSGPVTRMAAFAIDQTIVTVVFTVTLAIVSWALDFVTRGAVRLSIPHWLLLVMYGLWWLIYFAYPWAVSGKTPGMGLLGIRVVARDGADLAPRYGLLRALALPLGFVTFGLGFVGIVIGRERRGLHDRIARSAVVYNWDARAAQLRFLARSRPATTEQAPDA